MSDQQEYTEPTNEQLAKFLVVYAQNIPGWDQLELNVYMIERMLDNTPEYREGALRHHNRFQQEILEHAEKMYAGQLPCEHIRPNGKNCPNFNAPGTLYCGLHQDED